MDIKVPFVGYKIQYQNLKSEIDSAMQDVLSRGDLILRKDTEEFEKRLREFVGVKYAVGLNSGTDALLFSLLALGIGKEAAFAKSYGEPKDEVITVSHTFVASISAIVQVGATPVLVDVGDDYLMDANKLEQAITVKTKAIIPVHLNGRMCDMGKIMEIAQKHNLFIIEDAAQSLGAKIKIEKAGLPAEAQWAKAGSIGITGAFSFYPAKILGCFGDGGAITTNDEKIAEKIRLLRDHGQKTCLRRQAKTEILCYGWNSRLDNLEAAVLNVRMNYLGGWLKKRREIAGMYKKGLSDIEEIKLPLGPDDNSKRFDVFQNYVIRAQKRDELFNFLKENGVETLIKDPVPTHWQKGLNLSHFNLPLSEQLAKEVISLPMYPELTDEQINYTISVVRKFYRR